jgi:DMSO/TMAO reductase YedYZ heme-binding membrane subunit
MVAGLLATWGTSEAGLRVVVRATARTSLTLFLAAFLASALRRRWPTAATKWLLANRRYVGLGFAVSHLFHLLALVALGRWFPAALAGVTWPTLVVGGGGFVVVALLAATSSDAAVRRLGVRRWSALHRFGLYYLWVVFTVTYLGQSIGLAALLVAALLFRLRG